MDQNNPIIIRKAAPTAVSTVPNTIISITGEPFPAPTYDEMRFGRWAIELDEQAMLIEHALYHSLPGGVYDQLAVRIMSRKCTQLRVAHGERAE